MSIQFKQLKRLLYILEMDKHDLYFVKWLIHFLPLIFVLIIYRTYPVSLQNCFLYSYELLVFVFLLASVSLLISLFQHDNSYDLSNLTLNSCSFELFKIKKSIAEKSFPYTIIFVVISSMGYLAIFILTHAPYLNDVKVEFPIEIPKRFIPILTDPLLVFFSLIIFLSIFGLDWYLHNYERKLNHYKRKTIVESTK